MSQDTITLIPCEKNYPAEYRAWTSLRSRCNCPTGARWADYGGRGIKVCERWNSFALFLADMGPKPSPKHSIDRYPDNDGNYEPGNCEWRTQPEQLRNRRAWTWSAEKIRENRADRRGGRKSNPKWATAREEYEAGRMTVTQIAKLLGVSQPAVSAMKKREGWSVPVVQ